MGRTTKLTIRGRGESDAPTADDFVDQLRDYMDILKGVEQAITDGTNAIVWRIVKAETKSPILIEAEAFAREFAVHIDDRAVSIVRHTALGLQMLTQRDERPAYFTDQVLTRVERFLERVTNGLETTVIEFDLELPRIEITPAIARIAVANARKILRPEQKPYEELGSIEGYAQRVERDGYGRYVLWVHDRLTGESIKCVITGEAVTELERHQIGDVWRGRRLRVYGRLLYKGLGRLGTVEATRVRFLRQTNELPDVDDIQDPDFTGGLRSEDYLARLRDGKLS